MSGAADDLLARFEATPLAELLASARESARRARGNVITYSRKVFIPLTRLCRDTCGYCTFAHGPRQSGSPYMAIEEVLRIATAGKAAGCREALFTLGDRPEARYAAARASLRALGFDSTAAYLEYVCRRVIEETGLFPHINAGLLDETEMAALRRVSVSQGLMLESTAERLCHRGGAHFACPDKVPRVRLEAIDAAGRLAIPFTSGILVGIGETRCERIEALLALRDAHARHGHLQEVIVQNFRAKSNTRMAAAQEPAFEELLWSAAVARLVLPPQVSVQVPPNLSSERYPQLLVAGIDDWGGISPVTADHVNPEAPWPQLDSLASSTAEAGYALAQRLAIYPAYVRDANRWLDAALVSRVVRACDSEGFPREDGWTCGTALGAPPSRAECRRPVRTGRVEQALYRAMAGETLDADAMSHLFAARGGAVDEVCDAANALRRTANGDAVSYVVNRNINYTNVCGYACTFCAFSKGTRRSGRDAAYDLALDEVARRAAEAWVRGATEVCMQGGIHPAYTGHTYLALVRAVKQAVPAMHVHAFSPLEVSHGAATLGISLRAYLAKLQEAGLGSLPGTAAEILDDEVRRRICPDKLNTAQWLHVMEEAHAIGLRSTATIMFGHVERPGSWVEHLMRLRQLQERTGGFTEFVPLPFVHMEAPMSLRGVARTGPTWREVRLVHAVARLSLQPVFANVQASWTKLGPSNLAALLDGGVNDVGGTLMNESISRAAGAAHGQELAPENMEQLIRAAGRIPVQRTTLYGRPDQAQRTRSFSAAPLTGLVQTARTRQRTRVAS